MTLRGKLYTLFATTLVLTCSLTVGLLLEYTITELRDEINESTNASLFLTAQSIEELATREGHISANRIREELQNSLSQQPNIIGVNVLLPASQGGVFSVDLRDSADPWSADFSSANTRVMKLNLPAGEATLVAHIDDTIAFSVKGRLAGTFVVIAIIATLGGLSVLSWGTEHLVTRPLARLRKQVEGVTEGRLSTRLGKLRLRTDELGGLARSLQAMVGALAKAKNENEALISQMRESNRRLDEHVAERTAEVRVAHQDLAEAHAALLNLTEQLGRQERLAALGQLSGTIAHELGTPLSTISGHLELLLQGELSDEDRESIAIAHHEAVRMTGIIRRVLSSTRGKTCTPEELSVPAVVDQCLRVVLHPLDRTRLAVHIDIPPDAHSAYTDRGYLTQILINLVTNARDAMKGEGELTIRARRNGCWLRLVVDDTGPGVCVEARPRIFEPFYTTKDPEAGTGLGLAICSEITNTLGGRIAVEDNPAGGARFTVCLPAHRDSVQRSAS